MAIYTDYSKLVYNSERGGAELVPITDVESINNSLKNIFTTKLGSVPGKPKFGSRIHSLVFSLMDIEIEIALRAIIKEEVLKFEPRINLTEISIKRIPEYNRVVINLTYNFIANSLKTTGSTAIAFNQ